MGTKTIAELEAEHKALGVRIKTARRAEARRQREREAAAEQALGRWLLREWLDAEGADTTTLADVFRSALDSDQGRELVAERAREHLAPVTPELTDRVTAVEPAARAVEGGYGGQLLFARAQRESGSYGERAQRAGRRPA